MLLFLTDGQPNEPWGDEQYEGVKQQAAELGPNPTASTPNPAQALTQPYCNPSQAAELDVHVMTYALGDGADAAVTKQLACDARGISHVISDDSGDQLENQP